MVDVDVSRDLVEMSKCFPVSSKLSRCQSVAENPSAIGSGRISSFTLVTFLTNSVRREKVEKAEVRFDAMEMEM